MTYSDKLASLPKVVMIPESLCSNLELRTIRGAIGDGHMLRDLLYVDVGLGTGEVMSRL